ncbi:hypothetical protein NBRC10513_004919 [Rhodotorula toruloides]
MLFVSPSAAFALPTVLASVLPASSWIAIIDPYRAPLFLLGSQRTECTPPSPTLFSNPSIIISSASSTLGTPCTTTLKSHKGVAGASWAAAAATRRWAPAEAVGICTSTSPLVVRAVGILSGIPRV